MPQEPQLQRLELLEAAVAHSPVDVPLVARGLDDDVRRDVERLRQRSARVEVDELRARACDVARRAAKEVGCVDGDEDAAAAGAVGDEVRPALIKRTMQDR